MLRKFSLAALLLTAGIFLGGCAPKELIRPPQHAIDAYMQANPNLPQIDQACIADGRFEIGMLAATVRFMLGEPTSIEHVQQPWAKQEHWRFRRGKTRLFVIEDRHVVGIDEYSSKRR